MWAAPPDAKFEEVLKMIKDAGYEGVELTVEENKEIDVNSDESEVKKIKDKVLDTGLEISSVATGLFWENSLTSPDPEQRKRGEEILEKSINITNWVGTDALLVVPGAVQSLAPGSPIVNYETVYQKSQESIKKFLPLAEDMGVCICIENVWNKFLLSPLEMKKYVEEFNSENVGVYFDVGNVLAFGFPEMWIKILGKLIKRVHLKDFKTAVATLEGFCDLLEGDVNWPEVIRALQETGYSSYVTAELFPYKNFPETLIYKTSLSIDKILGRK
jgi:L-ribulose-5-phosphate 3-epimerase